VYSRKLEEAERLFGDLREMSERGIPIIVEGREDEKALRSLNVNGTIYCLKARGESRFSFVDRLSGTNEVILLTDFDREGRELRLWLYEELTRRRIKAEDKVWRRIRGLAKSEVHAVEELPSFIKTVRVRALASSQ
jgi:2,5-diamino-6-(ribosylamino)-4(3H)-pyrimidinone 5'-phosphate reductase